jgi:hypothetical protein
VSTSKIFIWTEALGCGEILKPCLESYITHHQFPIHVYLYEEDLSNIPVHPLIIPCVVSNAQMIDGVTRSMLQAAYKFGHRGTATLWGALINHREEEFMIHLDSDSIFLANVIAPISERLLEGYGVVGTRRPYKKRSNRKLNYFSLVHHLQPDAVNTHCFGFNRIQIGIKQSLLTGLIEGRGKNRVTQRLYPVIDFFDRVTFYLKRKSGIYYLDSPDQARSGTHDRSGPIESSMISFAAVGSGCAYFKNPNSATSPSYRDFAIRSYALYSAYLLGKQIDYPILESPYLVKQLELLDKSTWRLIN